MAASIVTNSQAQSSMTAPHFLWDMPRMLPKLSSSLLNGRPLSPKLSLNTHADDQEKFDPAVTRLTQRRRQGGRPRNFLVGREYLSGGKVAGARAVFCGQLDADVRQTERAARKLLPDLSLEQPLPAVRAGHHVKQVFGHDRVADERGVLSRIARPAFREAVAATAYPVIQRAVEPDAQQKSVANGRPLVSPSSQPTFWFDQPALRATP